MTATSEARSLQATDHEGKPVDTEDHVFKLPEHDKLLIQVQQQVEALIVNCQDFDDAILAAIIDVLNQINNAPSKDLMKLVA